jgi:RNA polymerase sigma-70 factor (ECF subfamily)
VIETNETLLDRLKADNAQEAWKEFYHLYWRSILRYACKLGLAEAQAQDVLQETMVALMRLLPGFAYDRRKGRFRNFLLTIVHRKSLAALRRVRRESEVPWAENGDHDGADPFGNGGAAEAEALARWRETLLEEALRCVRDDATLDGRTFAVFEAYAIAKRPVAEVAAEFGLHENAVYQIKNRLMRRIQAEVEKLMRSSGSA